MTLTSSRRSLALSRRLRDEVSMVVCASWHPVFSCAVLVVAPICRQYSKCKWSWTIVPLCVRWHSIRRQERMRPQTDVLASSCASMPACYPQKAVALLDNAAMCCCCSCLVRSSGPNEDTHSVCGEQEGQEEPALRNAASCSVFHSQHACSLRCVCWRLRSFLLPLRRFRRPRFE